MPRTALHRCLLGNARVLCIAMLCIVDLHEGSATGRPSCVATPLSRAEAESLVLAIPAALAAKESGGQVSAEQWFPGEDCRIEEFYFFMLLSTVGTPNTPLNNGMLGYFGVHKVTGKVVELNSSEPSVRGDKLLKVQLRLMTKHCITPSVVNRFPNISIER